MNRRVLHDQTTNFYFFFQEFCQGNIYLNDIGIQHRVFFRLSQINIFNGQIEWKFQQDSTDRQFHVQIFIHVLLRLPFNKILNGWNIQKNHHENYQRKKNQDNSQCIFKKLSQKSHFPFFIKD